MLLKFLLINNNKANIKGTGLLLKLINKIRFCRVEFIRIYKEVLF
jgi:hypothetical protein